VSEPAGQHAAPIVASRRIAELLRAQNRAGARAESCSALDGLPARLAQEIGEWQERVRHEGWQLDSEEWLLGLLALTRLTASERPATPATLRGTGKAPT
jgi:hypothetical protein